MAEILDLSVFTEETLDIKLPSGSIVHVKKPTERTFIKFLEFQNRINGGDENAILMAMNDMTVVILNSNTKGIDNTKAAENLTFEMKNAVIEAYTAFVAKLTNDPNLHSPQSPKKAKKAGKAVRTK